MNKLITLSIIFFSSFCFGQFNADKAYTEFANDIISIIKNDDINKYRSYYMNNADFEKYVHKILSAELNPYLFKKQGLNKFYNSYDEYIRKQTPSYNKYYQEMEVKFRNITNLTETVDGGEKKILKNFELLAISKQKKNEINLIAKLGYHYYSFEFEVREFMGKVKFDYDGFDGFKLVSNRMTENDWKKFADETERKCEQPCRERYSCFFKMIK